MVSSRNRWVPLLVMLTGCVHATWLRPAGSGGGSSPVASAELPMELYDVRLTGAFPEARPAAPVAAAPLVKARPAPVATAFPEIAEDEDADAEVSAAEGSGDLDEGEDEAEGSGDPSAPRYTADLDDATLAAKYKSDPASLGSLSLGLVGQGKLLNAVHIPAGSGAWTLTAPHAGFGTQETVSYVITAATEVARQFPGSPPLRINGISARDGGRIRPHKSHQNGRDVDLGFFYPGDAVRARARERYIDLARNWALVKSIVTLTDVQMILVDKHVQKVLYDYALDHGEDQAWLDSLFKGPSALLKHARRHRDHFHVRFYNPRAQELGRRVAPLLSSVQQFGPPRRHKVLRGETLASIARSVHTSPEQLAALNHLRAGKVSPGQVIQVPGKARTVRLPLPPPVVVPPRRLPPEMRTGPEVASLIR